ncbi:hypothetical protein M441DRAFT_57799 [Trichoderma asperellum CBS 433.97]|uniref:Uncharacterized protein n=1 Tax=Trichoderma asperellum (strain ATCC 204424 / CBS 433.97 / NBRC 101777) TaxID=1042311 RepID=A0A2T3ZA68_TRIA4|nr:hypothetical protein M441DRAFT_57799 [Trichoderma asperellum CBS 433.97]PTB41672.1 hypothetical protein M441DRAFT_57799 [Trichoderma asperellum CBS 433.97]
MAGDASMAPRAVDRPGLLHVLASRPANARAQRLFAEPWLLKGARASCPTPPSATPLWILQRRRVSALEAAHRSEAFPERSCLRAD